jgi:hypothetical protein
MTNTRRDITVSRDGNDGLKPTEFAAEPAIAAVPHSGHLKSASNNGICQGRAEGLKSSPSEGFLLLNFESPYRDIFALSLRLHGHKVFVPEEHGKTYSDLSDDQIRNFDYLFCNLTRRISHDGFQELRRICRVRRSDGLSLPKTCYVPEEWRPEFQRFIEAEFEAHIISCDKPDRSLLLEAIPNTSGNGTEKGGAQ